MGSEQQMAATLAGMLNDGLSDEFDEWWTEAGRGLSDDDEADVPVDIEDFVAPHVISTRTFDEVGMLTLNKGLVVRLSNGEEYQLTVVKSA